MLGVQDPKAAYERLDIKIWQDALQTELRASGLPGAIQKLTIEVVDSARISELLREADSIIKQLRKMSNVQEYVLFQYSSPSLDSVLQTKAP